MGWGGSGVGNRQEGEKERKEKKRVKKKGVNEPHLFSLKFIMKKRNCVKGKDRMEEEMEERKEGMKINGRACVSKNRMDRRKSKNK